MRRVSRRGPSARQREQRIPGVHREGAHEEDDHAINGCRGSLEDGAEGILDLANDCAGWYPVTDRDGRVPVAARRRSHPGLRPQDLGAVRGRAGSVLEKPGGPEHAPEARRMEGVVIFLVSSLAMNAGDPLLALAG